MRLRGLSRSPSRLLSFHKYQNPFWRCWWAGSAPRFLFSLHPHSTTQPRQEMSPPGKPRIQRPGRCLARGHKASWAWAARGKGAPAHTGGCPTGHHIPLAGRSRHLGTVPLPALARITREAEAAEGATSVSDSTRPPRAGRWWWHQAVELLPHGGQGRNGPLWAVRPAGRAGRRRSPARPRAAALLPLPPPPPATWDLGAWPRGEGAGSAAAAPRLRLEDARAGAGGVAGACGGRGLAGMGGA